MAKTWTQGISVWVHGALDIELSHYPKYRKYKGASEQDSSIIPSESCALSRNLTVAVANYWLNKVMIECRPVTI